jgi:hypothetical protein
MRAPGTHAEAGRLFDVGKLAREQFAGEADVMCMTRETDDAMAAPCKQSADRETGAARRAGDAPVTRYVRDDMSAPDVRSVESRAAMCPGRMPGARAFVGRFCVRNGTLRRVVTSAPVATRYVRRVSASPGISKLKYLHNIV